MKSIYVYGASGHGLVVADIAKACGYNNILFIDDGENEYLSFDEVDKFIYSQRQNTRDFSRGMNDVMC